MLPVFNKSLKFQSNDYHGGSSESLMDISRQKKLYTVYPRKWVSLGPINFMSNVLLYYFDAIKNEDAEVDTAEHDEPQEWTSSNDIAHVAARILCNPIDKHQDDAYELVSDIKRPSERATMLSNILGRTTTYKQIPLQDMYNKFIKPGFDHATGYYLASYQDIAPVTQGLSILLDGQAPETFDVW